MKKKATFFFFMIIGTFWVILGISEATEGEGSSLTKSDPVRSISEKSVGSRAEEAVDAVSVESEQPSEEKVAVDEVKAESMRLADYESGQLWRQFRDGVISKEEYIRRMKEINLARKRYVDERALLWNGKDQGALSEIDQLFREGIQDISRGEKSSLEKDANSAPGIDSEESVSVKLPGESEPSEAEGPPPS